MITEKDLIIIGGGAAGLSAAQYGSRANLSTLLIEEMASGGQALLINSLENYPGLEKPVTGYDFAANMENQARSFGAEIISSTVQKLEKKGDRFFIESSAGVFSSYAVILSTGAKHKHLGIPGETELSGRGVSYCATCDGPFFKGKKILVVGGGDAACDEAIFLAQLTDTVIVAHRRDRFRAQGSLAERVLKNPHIETRFNTLVTEIKGTGKVSSVVFRKADSEKTWEEPVDAVFIFIGSVPQTQLVPYTAKDEAGYILTDCRMETNIPGLYAAGDVRSTPFRQVIVAAADGAIAAHSASQYIDELKGKAYK